MIKNLLAQRIVATPQAFRRNEAKAKWRKACFLRKQKCAQNKTSKIARIETVTKAKSVDKVIEELKAKEIKNQDSSKSKNEVTTVQQQTYIPAQIKADGKINRQILGTVSGNEFVTERNNLLNVSNPLVSKGTNTISISEMVKQQVAEQINENKTSFVQDNTVINERIAVETSSNQDSVTQNVLQTESVEYSLETKKPKVYKKVEQTPEEIKMTKMNANYEHDKAVLAKEDPMFAKNKFWDVGHAEGSGENELTRNIKTKFVAEKINQQMDDILN